ncbi:uncharacterized protein BBOV_IV008390 [Babesia bovis T2Bo]|uniref:Pantothenate kinase n=1 Tax=Babesia bovis TaxID=5865 RepID=A7ARM4_BABBO|nr:uncharacterized protein BBOV_IV008390 [Babesia bovis T2Bo]EDO07193.1 hypothetical protein BBOV_IV008390 [Babesia bovis T2Bo]|eukprot:XP_001610761.1 hypothetical protein [Babesia bovis T2Bo]
MGNVIGVDCSYASKKLLDRFFVTVVLTNKDDERCFDGSLANCRFISFCDLPIPITQNGNTYRFLTVDSDDAETAIHLLSNYRHKVKRVTFCGSPATSILTTVESLLPNSVISECEYETCLHLGKSLFGHSEGNLFSVDDAGNLTELNEAFINGKGHIHAAVHSHGSYFLYPGANEPYSYLCHSVIGYSAVFAIYNMFLLRYVSNEASRVYISEIGDLASRGSSASCDMLVENIYGGACESIGLSGKMLASSFGKLHKRPELWMDNSFAESKSEQHVPASHPHSGCTPNPNDLNELQTKQSDANIMDDHNAFNLSCNPENEEDENSHIRNLRDYVKEEDLAHSLLKVVVINVTQNACLHAKIKGVDRLLFSGLLFDSQWFRQMAKSYVNRWSNCSFTMLVYSNSEFFASLGASEWVPNINN